MALRYFNFNDSKKASKIMATQILVCKLYYIYMWNNVCGIRYVHILISNPFSFE